MKQIPRLPTLVADLRAPTPSAAAELAVWDYRLFAGQIDEYGRKLRKNMGRQLELARLKKDQYASRLKYLHPGVALIQKKQRLADAEDTLRQLMEKRMEGNRHRLALCAERIRGLSPVEKLGKRLCLCGTDRKWKKSSCEKVYRRCVPVRNWMFM